ncbi:25S rRNA (adenine645-N1)-methyltransferase [Entophlyctis sp. JEL0112]|nr:25S rRNA (adenine645-N1)-methyltransferase [Entophlyctis sp. JEL0112]
MAKRSKSEARSSSVQHASSAAPSEWPSKKRKVEVTIPKETAQAGYPVPVGRSAALSKKSKLLLAIQKSKQLPLKNEQQKKLLSTATTRSTTSTSKQRTNDVALTDLQSKMKKTLAGGRFRMINETLYTAKSDVALKLFRKEPKTFYIYHEGFREQVKSWPSNPVNIFIESLMNTISKNDGSRPTIVVDMGCGEAVLAQKLMALNTASQKKFEVHSFDLASPNEYVVACDIRSVPLKSCYADVVIFSLSLMGTNFMEFLAEGHRILKVGGQLRIAEVVSRFPDIEKFIFVLCELGFKLLKKVSLIAQNQLVF